ncbi:MAG: C-GCAxxG-C-C family protein [Treponema sp.]|nr:C-GCAxxG-C-C family protein [Treponema sp.]
MTPEQAGALAEANFKKGYNCTQAVLCTFAERLGLSEKEALRISQPLGGGMCRMRETCGSVTGMLLALGLLEGSDNPADKAAKDTIYAHGQELAARFRSLNGSIECRELLGLVPMGTAEKAVPSAKIPVGTEYTVPVSEARTEEYYKKRPCPKLCAMAAEIFQSYLDENGISK